MAYQGFEAVVARLEREGRSPASARRIAAAIARKAYGNQAVQHAAATGTSLRGHKKMRGHR